MGRMRRQEIRVQIERVRVKGRSCGLVVTNFLNLYYAMGEGEYEGDEHVVREVEIAC